jgi:hypothetical protein
LKDAQERNGKILREVENFKEDARKAERSKIEAELAESRRLKKEAFESGEYAKMEQADLLAENARKRAAALTQAPVTGDPIFSEWQDKNTWYANPQAAYEADAVGARIAQEVTGGENRPLSPFEYRYVLDKVASEVGSKYGNAPAKPATAPPVVNAPKAAVQQANRNRTRSFADLSADEKDAFKQFQRHGIYKNTGDLDKDARDYIRELDASSDTYILR